jgi:hypothetical protein
MAFSKSRNLCIDNLTYIYLESICFAVTIFTWNMLHRKVNSLAEPPITNAARTL